MFDLKVNRRFYPFVWTLIFVAGLLFASEKVQAQQARKVRILFVLDASGSMKASFGNESRMVVAKKILGSLIDSLAGTKNLELALRVYGHQAEVKDNNCSDTRLMVPFAPNNHAKLKSTLLAIEPKGVTPIGYSIEAAATDFPKEAGVRNMLLLITDGLESCGKDLCAIAQKLESNNVFMKPYIVGLGGDKQMASSFQCLGPYFDANNTSALKSVLSNIVRKALGKTRVLIELKDHTGNPITNMSLSFFDERTGNLDHQMVHFRDNLNRTDTIFDLAGEKKYRLQVGTIPALYKEFFVEEGIVNKFEVVVSTGYLTINHTSSSPYGKLNTLIRKGNETITSNIQGQPTRLLSGRYDLEVLTMPKTMMPDVNIVPGKNISVTILEPGMLNIPQQIPGQGDLFYIPAKGAPQLIYHLENTRIDLPLQPGKYSIVFKPLKALGSRFSVVRKFNIESGKNTSFNLI